MGSLLCECRIIVICSINVKRQVWRAFQNEGGADKVSRRADMGSSWVVIRVSRRKSYGRISNIIMESLFIDQKRGWGRIPKSRRGVRQSKPCHLSYSFISGSNQDGEKIRAFLSVQNTLINQQRTSQMMRCSPTAFDDGYTVLPATWHTMFLVSKTRGP